MTDSLDGRGPWEFLVVVGGEGAALLLGWIGRGISSRRLYPTVYIIRRMCRSASPANHLIAPVPQL